MSSTPKSPVPKNSNAARSHLNFPVVGIGASAGGLKALMRLFEHMPRTPDMAFVVILHLSPRHESSAHQILQGATSMHVRQVTQAVPIERNHIYVIPPGKDLSMSDGYLRLVDSKREGGALVAIDLFFRALADVHDSRAIGIVLSGSGSDGAVGLARIKEQGGVTIAQSPEDAEFDSMPRSAIETGAVDIVLPVVDIADRLVELARNFEALVTHRPDAAGDIAANMMRSDVTLAKTAELALRDILAILRSRTGHDFRHYKQATVLRRIERRMQVNALSEMAKYAAFLREHMAETPELLSDMLIGVTNFFRDREAFEALEREVIPQLFEQPAGQDDEREVRVWSAGCSTGEEAYSLAMLLTEHAEANCPRPRVHVFATDIDEPALEAGRAGQYPAAIVTDVSPARLRHFFAKDGVHYRVRKELRERILFARHHVLRDPPFSRLDMISCRNLLIYLDRDIQSEVLRIFHFALKPGGFLFLGSSETPDACGQLFTTVDKKNRIYRAREAASMPGRRAPTLLSNGAVLPTLKSSDEQALPKRRFSFAEVHQRVLEQYAPPSVIVNAHGDIVHMSERAGRYLRYVGGEPSLSLTTLVHPELRLELRTALYQAGQSRKSVEARRVKLQHEGRSAFINMVVRPFRDEAAGADFMLVLFDEVEDSLDESAAPEHRETKDSLLVQLEDELQNTKEQLQLTIEHSETSSEELRASNEELQAINEELRSATEELETSKEELQSINEEMLTVNAELKVKVDETSKINDDLQNLIASTDIATVFIDRETRIKWFTPRTRALFNVIGEDAGRSLLDITHRLSYPDLGADIRTVLEHLKLVEREVPRDDGRMYLARLLPYRTTDDRIQGAVLTFIDITERRQAEERMRAGEAHLKLLAQSTKGYAIITTDREGLITTWNPAAEAIFGYKEAEALGQPMELMYTPEDRELGVAEAERKRALEEGSASDERWHQRKDGTTIFCSGLVNPLIDGELIGFAKIARDVTEQQQRTTAQQTELETVQASSLQKDQFFAVLSHELKHPLNLIQLNTELIARAPAARASGSVAKATTAIRTAVRNQSRIIDDLMDMSRVRTGKLKLNFTALLLQDLLDGVAHTFAPSVQDDQITFETDLPEDPLYVSADPTRLEQIIWNLLNNSGKFTPGGGLISLRLQREGDLARIDVIDTGEGISEDFLPRVFEMFGQADVQHAHRSQHGLGIGLALVHQLVEAHGGRIEAFSEGLGRGARFTVWLPICLETETQLEDSSGGSARGRLKAVKVLLVEDSADTLEAMRLLLGNEGADVTAASNGAEALERAARQRFNVIVSDIGMSGMDGHAMMRALRANPLNEATPAIALTGYGSAQDVEKAKAAGFTLHLRKPVDMDTLLAAVLQCVH